MILLQIIPICQTPDCNNRQICISVISSAMNASRNSLLIAFFKTQWLSLVDLLHLTANAASPRPASMCGPGGPKQLYHMGSLLDRMADARVNTSPTSAQPACLSTHNLRLHQQYFLLPAAHQFAARLVSSTGASSKGPSPLHKLKHGEGISCTQHRKMIMKTLFLSFPSWFIPYY